MDKQVPNYLEVNLAHWNQNVPHHLASEFYQMEAFKAGADSLNDIEKDALGYVAGKSLLHLQCHFGQDTLSWARKGATVTGIDFSDAGIATARALSSELEIPAAFVQSDVYELPQHLEGQFDIVFTSYGAIGWLPDMARWAGVVRHFLKPGGTFLIAEFHPVLFTFDDDFEKIHYSYFNRAPIVFEVNGTYADPQAPIRSTGCSWNHPLSDVIGALLQQGLQLELFQEFDYSPYNCFPNLVEVAPGKYQLKGYEGILPMVYVIKMRG